MREYIGYTHISQGVESFGPAVSEALSGYANSGYDIDVHYSQSTEPRGRIMFSALITAWTQT
ncbi:hypothetical protein BSK66_07850 [Paenibacillus odorifer]|uniref:Uncharacterized protein n=1 Tax=Paenibacillus odorifer TaxID=189426 RepID=A0A1R0X3A2_9BACL|nr:MULTISPECIES: hypothetical protein [Paenibacillus]ETT64916.1 hypothetical protein C171_07867 [Paenibacillus sp. FSL H8-237]OMD27473.1 hypothetical protein BJP51_25080 [Paenibacillus odorifer]OME61035.1 hypothetical protein BSK66_07850 [Paenibacillus odorifer]